jgi:hypothetical protein
MSRVASVERVPASLLPRRPLWLSPKTSVATSLVRRQPRLGRIVGGTARRFHPGG